MRPLCVLLFTTLPGCALSSIQSDDSLPDDAGVGAPSANVLPDGGRGDDGATLASSLDASSSGNSPSLSQADATVQSGADAGVSDASASAGHDASGSDSGAHDAGSDASTGTDAAASCVPDVCNARCGVFKGCCNSQNMCACEDLLGLCILPAT